ncbi:MAG TPA: 3-hydroxyacyl-CoA dehydrogenase family protein [Bryobacteraceae bacterium]|nr:3-hydroxyacyl-CoA dehydrogenase family protein [Bryobacteraceae bacterium]
MDYARRLENVTVLGAAGKMGSGIVLLTAMEMADLSLEAGQEPQTFSLNAVDASAKGLCGLQSYLRNQVQKAAEKKTVALRKAYQDREDLVENEEIIKQYVEDVLALVHPATQLEAAYDSDLVFEAVPENPGLKIKLLSQIRSHSSRDPWFFTNTSSIPISELNDKVNLGGRIIGYHFYNPPAVQKLVEMICADATLPDLAGFAEEFASRLRKVVVPSRDIAGFIGNGHFMRDALHGISEVERLSPELGFVESVYTVNKVSQDFLIRPMGIFQLIDYVGLDVCQYILRVMDERLAGARLHSPLLDRLIAAGVLGGQYADGSQKDGFLKYDRGRPAGVFDPERAAYIPSSEIAARCDERLGALPGHAKPWKAVIQDRDRARFLEAYFGQMKESNTFGAMLARRYGQRSKEIGLGLLSDKVAARAEDVNTVLETGFYHAYGPINDYFD